MRCHRQHSALQRITVIAVLAPSSAFITVVIFEPDVEVASATLLTLSILIRFCFDPPSHLSTVLFLCARDL